MQSVMSIGWGTRIILQYCTDALLIKTFIYTEYIRTYMYIYIYIYIYMCVIVKAHSPGIYGSKPTRGQGRFALPP